MPARETARSVPRPVIRNPHVNPAYGSSIDDHLLPGLHETQQADRRSADIIHADVLFAGVRHRKAAWSEYHRRNLELIVVEPGIARRGHGPDLPRSPLSWQAAA